MIRWLKHSGRQNCLTRGAFIISLKYNLAMGIFFKSCPLSKCTKSINKSWEHLQISQKLAGRFIADQESPPRILLWNETVDRGVNSLTHSLFVVLIQYSRDFPTFRPLLMVSSPVLSCFRSKHEPGDNYSGDSPQAVPNYQRYVPNLKQNV